MIIIKNEKEIELMRRGGKILAEVINEIGRKIAPGVNTLELDELAEKLILENGGKPAFKGYGEKSNPYPSTICASINSEVVHGIPDRKKIIQEGDLVKIDIGMEKDGMITDMARTFPVENISVEANELINATMTALNNGIAKIKAGKKLSEYSQAVEDYIVSMGFSVIHELVGHGVGKYLHEDPQVPNYWGGFREITLQEGMTLALEPMINFGKREIKLSDDGWTYITKDGSLSAHFEDTVLVKKNGCEILTRI